MSSGHPPTVLAKKAQAPVPIGRKRKPVGGIDIEGADDNDKDNHTELYPDHRGVERGAFSDPSHENGGNGSRYNDGGEID